MRLLKFPVFIGLFTSFYNEFAMGNYASFRFKNQCPHPIDVHQVTGNKPHSLKRVAVVSSGSRQFPTYAKEQINLADWHGLFRHTKANEATLAEFTLAGGKAWYDISIIPPGCSGGCKSLGCCKRQTKKKGFNVSMMIEPKTNENKHGYRCHTIMCTVDGCVFRKPIGHGKTYISAYHFPSDNRNVFSCPKGTKFDVIFCP